jgi:hypothetical protein
MESKVGDIPRCMGPLVNTPQLNPQLHCTHSLNRTRSIEPHSPGADHREHRLHHLFYFCVTLPHMHMLWALNSNGCMRHVSWHLLYFCLRPLPSNGWCFQNHFLATGLYATVLYSSWGLFVRKVCYLNQFLVPVKINMWNILKLAKRCKCICLPWQCCVLLPVFAKGCTSDTDLFQPILMSVVQSEWCYSYYITLYFRIGMLLMWDVLIRCNYLGRATMPEFTE